MITHNQNHAAPNRVGLFGGTFNPIHRGHTQVAEDVLKQYGLDQVYFIPSAIPPHKAPSDTAAAHHRLAMVKMALQGKSRMSVSDIELQRKGPSYTIETLRWFKTADLTAPDFFFIVGIDAFLEIHTWKTFIQLFDETAFIIMSRPQPNRSAFDFTGAAAAYTREQISRDYQLSADAKILRHPVKHPLYLASVRPLDIASSRIREAVRERRSFGHWVDPAVAQYIETKGLYR